MRLNNINEYIGNTPLIKLNSFCYDGAAEIWGKCEYLNPSGSNKDRIAKFIIEDAIKNKTLKPGGLIIEATAGNTGLAFAMQAAQKGYRCIFVMPDKMSSEKVNMLKAFGAEIVMCPTQVPSDSPEYYVNVANKMHAENPDALYINQYFNLNNPQAYYETLGPELYQELDGQIDAYVAGAGTGGTISGAGKYLKEKIPNCKLIAAEPEGSIYGHYHRHREIGGHATYLVEGIGQDIVTQTMDFDLVDEVRAVNDTDSFKYARDLIRDEGLFCGGSTGTALKVAVDVAKELDANKKVVVVLCDSADRYLTKFISDQWMQENNFMEKIEEDNNYAFSTRAIHEGQHEDPVYHSATTPIFQTSTYGQVSPGQFVKNYDYARSANPTRTAMEKNLASLENAKFCSSFSSGCAATDAILHTLHQGDHVLLSDDLYGGTFRICNQVFKQLGLEFSIVDFTSEDSVRKAIQNNTKLAWVETPSNPLLKVIDIAKTRELLTKEILLIVDNTFATPYLQNPLDLGADLVCHSTTKYIGGHSDMIGGAVMLNDEDLAARLAYIQNAVGAIPGPFECFLTLRSVKTLDLRVQAQTKSANQIAEFLETQSCIEKVLYPGLKSHPQHEIASKQMRDYGAMITFIMKDGLAPSRKFLEALKLFTIAESLGGVKSLIEHPAIMTHASIPKEQREASGISDGLIRLSIGTESVDDLIGDLKQSFSLL